MRKNNQTVQGKKSRQRWRSLWRAVALLVIWGGIVLALVLGWYATGLPSIDNATALQRRPLVVLYDRSGEKLVQFGEQAGQPVVVADLPPYVWQALLAIEDRRFYRHFGLDPLGLARAMWHNVRAGQVVAGGSTITQQLAKNLFLTPDQTLRRKIQEALLAMALEYRFSKDEILAAYLNRVYFGAGAYGVDAAAWVYFNKPATSLNLREAALLAGLLKAPSRLSPRNNMGLAEQRTRIVLQAMRDAGYLTAEQAQQALAAPPLLPGRRPGAAVDARYAAAAFYDAALPLLANPNQDLQIYTTLDRRIQFAAEQAFQQLLQKEGEKAKIGQGAILVMDNLGQVVALVGGRDFAESNYNRAIDARRPAGSSFKPFVYLAALMAGHTPEEPIDDTPLQIGKWRPQNYDGKFVGTITLAQALAESRNTPAVRMLQQVGLAPVQHLARDLGITGDLTDDLTLALGSSDVSLWQMVAAYAVLQRQGQAVQPYGISRITNKAGEVLFVHEPPAAMPQLVPANVAQTLTQMLTGVLAYGTGQAAAFDWQAAGKTGTSQDYRDAWFIGYSAAYVAGVWLGNDDNSPMHRVTGGGAPARLWREVMLAAHQGLPRQPLLPEPILIESTLVQPTLVPADTAAITTEPAAPAPMQDTSQTLDGFLENLFR